MFWTLVTIIVVALAVGAWAMDRRSKQRHETGALDVGQSPRMGGPDGKGDGKGSQIISGTQGGRIDQGGTGGF